MINIYERAIQILQERGWGQGAYYTTDGGRCLVSALAEAEENENLTNSRTADHLATNLNLFYPEKWNDEPGRTLEEVILLLKYAAADELATWSKLYGPSNIAEPLER